MSAYATGVVADADTLQTMYDAQQADAERLATAASERVARPDLAATAEAVFGRPATATLDVADRFGPDLLVVGTRGLGPLTSALVGSVSEELVDHAPCPVLVARSSALRRVLLAGDGSPDAQAARARSSGSGRSSSAARSGWSAWRSGRIWVRRPTKPG